MPELTSVPFSAQRLFRASIAVIGPLITPVILLGGILSGPFTPTEAASVAVAYMLVLGVIYCTATLKVLWQALKETAAITGGIMLILGAASLIGLILTRAHVSRDIAEFLIGVSENPIVFIILADTLVLIFGCLIDATAIILATVASCFP